MPNLLFYSFCPMQFTEPLAEQLIRRFHLAPGTIRTWRRRGQIPDRYADPGYRLRHGDASLSAPVARVLALPALRLRGFGSSNPHRLNYVLHKGGAFSAEEALALYAELQAVRGLARAFLAAPSEAALRALLGDARIRPTKLLGPECWELVAAVGRGEVEGLERVSVAVRELEKGVEVG